MTERVATVTFRVSAMIVAAVSFGLWQGSWAAGASVLALVALFVNVLVNPDE